MMNLRSSLSALALVGAVFGYSSAAHATNVPLTDYVVKNSLSATNATYNNLIFTVFDDHGSRANSPASGPAAEPINGYGVQLSGLIPLTSRYTATKASNDFASAIEFTLGSGKAVTWHDYSSSGSISKIQYELVAGSPSAKNTSYGSLTPLARTGTVPGTLTWSNLVVGDQYSLIIEGTTETTGSITGTLSAVPLPGSLLMFGSALLGLTAFGARRRPTVSV